MNVLILMFRRTLLACYALAIAMPAALAQTLEIPIIYLEREIPPPPTLSNLDPPPEDAGLAGARLGIEDSNTTGKFLGQEFSLVEVLVPEDADLITAAGDQLQDGALVVMNTPTADVIAVADALPNALVFNAGAKDNELRLGDCRANLLHTLPSRAMLADALAQFLRNRQWSNWFLIEGPGPTDRLWADALRASATKYGQKIVEDKAWTFDADMRRNAAQEVPLFTQGADHDVIIVADEINDFARYVPYNTWQAVPVAGSAGLVPVAWAPVVEQWGAAQLQGRFGELAERPMRSLDYAAWAAVRSIAEAVTRTNANDTDTIRDYIMSEDFELAAFKGRKMSFRHWNGQLRQPIPLVHPEALTASAPLEGFLHERSDMDTLGFDEPESGCTAFQ